MADRLEAMSLLVAVVDAGGFSAAARRLALPLATVSRKVADLEAHLGVQLLQRSTRHIALTDAGRSYVEACRRILDDVNETERAATGEYAAPKGDLVITAPVVFGRLHVTPVVVAFLKAFPAINIRLLLSDRISHLLEEHIDLAVRIGPLPDSSLVATRVGEVRQVVCACPEYLAQRGVPVLPEDISAHDCISYEGLAGTQAWAFYRGEQVSLLPIKPRLIVNGAEAALDAACGGLGLTRVLSYQCEPARQAGKVQIVLEDFEPAPWPVSLVYAGQGRLPIKLRAFLDFAAPRLRSQPLHPGQER
ncbi:LysR family transcriptional regulator [Aquitalea aquatilis]|uniref:LysR family transcriptional regulator n=1 Tax=Aquitalea aquatilis TaxID=1537400 RepID=UPI00196AFF9F|nr:LysR family transcriptional regulator [Aquitalea aquatilis]